MGQVAPAVPPVIRKVVEKRSPSRLASPELRFTALVLREPPGLVRKRSTTLVVSLVLHAMILATAVVIPLFLDESLPAPGEAVRAFFGTPATAAPPPPPPPPPPPAAARSAARSPEVPRPPEPARFVAPVEVPETIAPEEGLELGVEGGVPGGVEGGVPGGVVGGIVGGLPSEAPPPPPRVVRVGGQIVAPKLVHEVMPEYPPLALQARMQGVVILEALVDTNGYVKEVKVLRSMTLLDDAAIAAVKQWRYKPLLLNGQPVEFVLTVIVRFNLQAQNPPRGD